MRDLNVLEIESITKSLGKFPCVRILNDDEYIQEIEKALQIDLTQWQKKYLLGKNYEFSNERQTGKTFIFCVYLALNEKELPISKPELFSDRFDDNYSKGYFRNLFEDVRNILQRHGFEVCRLNYKK